MTQDITFKATLEVIKSGYHKDSLSYVQPSEYNRTGSMETSLNLLRNANSNKPLPYVLPCFSISIPEPILALRDGAQCYSNMGLFENISRAWITIDNKLVLWNYANGKEFTVYNDHSYIIKFVKLFKPDRSIFQTCITHHIALISQVSISLLGVSFNQIEDPIHSVIELITLDYSLSTSYPITHLSQHPTSRKVYCADTKGFLYELGIQKSNTLLCNKFSLKRMESHSLISFVQRNLFGTVQSSARDLTIDAHRNLLYLLHSDSTIQVWEFNTTGTSISYWYTIPHPSTSFSLAQEIKLHSLTTPLPSSPEVALIAVTTTGIRLYYSKPTQSWYMPIKSKLSIAEHALYPIENSTVSHVFHSRSYDLLAIASRNENSRTTLFTSYAPYMFLAPNQNTKDAYSTYFLSNTSLNGDTNSDLQIECIGESSNELSLAKNTSDMFKQVHNPSHQLLFLHRYGLIVHLLQRPVDTLHFVLSLPPSIRSKQYDLLMNTYSSTDIHAMLCQIGCANLVTENLHIYPSITQANSTKQLSNLAYTMQAGSSTVPQLFSEYQPDAVFSGRNKQNRNNLQGDVEYVPQSIGLSLISPPTDEIKNIALRTLCFQSQPTITPNVCATAGIAMATGPWTHQEVILTPACLGIQAYITRLLSPFISEPIIDPNTKAPNFDQDDTRQVCSLMRSTLDFLRQLEGSMIQVESGTGDSVLKRFPVIWESDRAIVQVGNPYERAARGHLGPADAHELQSVRLASLGALLGAALRCLQGGQWGALGDLLGRGFAGAATAPRALVGAGDFAAGVRALVEALAAGPDAATAAELTAALARLLTAPPPGPQACATSSQAPAPSGAGPAAGPPTSSYWTGQQRSTQGTPTLQTRRS